MEWKSKMRERIVSFMLLFSFLLGLFTPMGTLAEEKHNDTLYVFDMEAFFDSLPNTKVQYDYLSFATALQGLANRKSPQLYFIITKATKYVDDEKDVNIDQFWLDELRKNGKYLSDFNIKTVAPTKEAFFQLVSDIVADEKNQIEGVVLWDENVPATSNVASTIAGVENLLPVRYDVDEKRSLYKDLFEADDAIFEQSFVKKTLVGKFTGAGTIPDSNTPSTGSKKNDAYIWAKEQYLDKGLTNPLLLASSLDAFTWRVPERFGDDMRFVSCKIPKTMRPGECVGASVTVENIGTSTWSKDKLYRLSNYDFGWNPCAFTFVDGEYGTEPSWLYIKEGEEIEPGEQYTFRFTLKAPEELGKHELALRMVNQSVSGGFFFGDTELSRTIMVEGEPVQQNLRDAQVLSVKYPKVLGKTQVGDVEVTVKNIGLKPWKSTRDEKDQFLGDRLWNEAEAVADAVDCVNNGNDEVLWISRVYFGDDEVVMPGETKTFRFGIKARNATSTTYSFSFIMEHTGYGYSGSGLHASGQLVDTDVEEMEYETITAEEVDNDLPENSNEVDREWYEEELDPMPFQYPDPEASITTIADYLIGEKAFFWDLSPDPSIAPVDDREQIPGTDTQTLRGILESQNRQAKERTENGVPMNVGHVPWRVKYCNIPDGNSNLSDIQIEERFSGLLAEYHIQADNQVIGNSSLANWSVLSKVPPLEKYDQEMVNKKGADNEIEYDENTKYITFYMGDYDNTSWTSNVLPIFWNDPKRGEIPLGWAPQPGVAEKAPHIFNYLYETMTSNDYFVSSNMGGIDPRNEEIDEGTKRLFDLYKQQYERLDIDISGAVYGGSISESMQKAYSELTPAGVACNASDRQLVYNDTAFAYMSFVGVLTESAEQFANDLWTTIRGGNQFYYVRTVLVSPSVIVDAMELLKEQKPDAKIEVVDPYTFFKMYKETNGGVSGVASVKYESEYTAEPVSVDGQIQTNEWDFANEFEVSSESKTVQDYGAVAGTVGGKDDLAANYKIKWDDENLYILEQRTDNVLNLSETGPVPTYVVDCSMLQLDLDYLRTGTSYTGNSYSVYFTPKGADGKARVFLRGEGYPSGNDKDISSEVQIAADIQATGYTLELAIPWSTFYNEEFKPENNKKIGMSMISIDNDNGAGFKGQVIWAGNGDDKANWAEMQFVGKPDTEINKTELNQLIEESKTLVKEGYTEESWKTFEAALKAAMEVSGKGDVSQEEVDSAKEALKAAKEGLEKVTAEEADKTELNQLIKESEALVKEEYTEESWKVFEEALKAAMEVSGKGDASQEEVDSAKEALKAAKEGLEKKKGDNMNSDKPTDKPDSSAENAGKGIPDTGDDTGILPVLAVCFVSALTVAGVMKRRRNRYL